MPASGHLAMRKDLVHNLQENFTYDNLKRLKTVAGTPANVPALNMNYDDNGNINTKSDAGTFAYDPANRVSEIDPYVNIPAAKQTLTYTPFKKVKTINENGITATFTYWPDGERASLSIARGAHPRIVYYAPDYEKIIAGSSEKEYCYLKNEQGNIAAIIGTDDVTGKPFRYYVLTDYLGSLSHVLNTNGSIVEENSYDAWGRYRNPVSWIAYAPTYSNMLFYRGHTGHEYIPEFGIINMNGRLYDPLVGRMFSPDPYIMGNDNTQGYNRYTYALNNPLIYTDPNGEYALVDNAGAMLVGGIINLVSNAIQGNVSSWGQGIGYLVSGAAAGEATLYVGQL